MPRERTLTQQIKLVQVYRWSNVARTKKVQCVARPIIGRKPTIRFQDNALDVPIRNQHIIEFNRGTTLPCDGHVDGMVDHLSVVGD